MNFEVTLDYIVIAGALTILGLWLNKFEPPIKRQWIAVMLFFVGIIAGHVRIDNAMYGFLIAGLVFYKDDLVIEVRSIVESFRNIKDS